MRRPALIVVALAALMALFAGSASARRDRDWRWGGHGAGWHNPPYGGYRNYGPGFRPHVYDVYPYSSGPAAYDGGGYSGPSDDPEYGGYSSYAPPCDAPVVTSELIGSEVVIDTITIVE